MIRRLALLSPICGIFRCSKASNRNSTMASRFGRPYRSRRFFLLMFGSPERFLHNFATVMTDKTRLRHPTCFNSRLFACRCQSRFKPAAVNSEGWNLNAAACQPFAELPADKQNSCHSWLSTCLYRSIARLTFLNITAATVFEPC